MVKIIKKCEFCNKEMKLTPSQKDRKYCNQNCYRGYEKMEYLIKKCEFCNKEMKLTLNQKDKRYCNQKCYRGHSAQVVIKKCIICNDDVPISSSTIYSIFCSHKCRMTDLFGDDKTGLKSYLERYNSSKIYSSNFNNKFKKLIRDRDNNKCMRCGRPREVFNRALAVHHIDGDKMNTIKENCISLCNSCHGLTIKREVFFIKRFQKILSKLYGYKYE